MKTIYKFPFDVADSITIEMPFDAKILSVQAQEEQPCIWAEVETLNSKHPRHFRCFGTGHQIDDDSLQFVGTFQLAGRSFVGHLYEETEN